MTTDELIEALERMKSETGSLADSLCCLGYGHEHNCGLIQLRGYSGGDKNREAVSSRVQSAQAAAGLRYMPLQQAVRNG